MPSLFSKMSLVAAVATAVEAIKPPKCNTSTPAPTDPKNCPLKAPADSEFATICHPGARGHAGGAEMARNRCGGKYKDGTMRCACCGQPLFYASALFHPQGDGWPAFHGNASVKASGGAANVCTPGGTEVVCATCGSHLGDYFAQGWMSDYEYYCIDGVCMLPPGAKDGEVCQPTTAPSEDAVLRAARLRKMANEKTSIVV